MRVRCVHIVLQRFFPQLITEEEMDVLEDFAKQFSADEWERTWEPEYYIPLSWAADVIHMARRRNLIASDILAKLVLRVLYSIVLLSHSSNT